MQELISGQKDAGHSILLLEQNISMIESVADRVLAIDVRGLTFTLEKHEIKRDAVLAALEI